MLNKSIDENEIKKFSQIADEWWDRKGKFKLLHEINHPRVEYIKNFLHDKKIHRILDIGCGGGILSESIAKLGYHVTALDPAYDNIKAAQLHQGQNLDIDYHHSTLEEFAAHNPEKQFDVVLCMEVVEHVADLYSFIDKATEMLKTSGFIFLSTINRTIKSYLQAIITAEYLLRWLPRGTHQWKKFVSPHEIRKCFVNNQVELIALDGISYSLIHQEWVLSKKTSVNYILIGQKA